MAFESQAARDARIDVSAVIGALARRLPRIALVAAALLGLALVVTTFMPRLYESSASILVEPRNNIYLRSANEIPSTAGGEAGAVSSQIELIKSRDTLLKVIDRLDLRSVPEFNGAGGGGFSPLALVSQLLGRKSAAVSVDEIVLGTLYDRLTVVQERDSRIISVIVRSTSPQLAADIANAVANAHVSRRAELSLSDTMGASSWLADEIARLRVAVTAAETEVANFKVNNDMFIGSNNTSLADQQLSTVATQITAAQERRNAALSRAALIRGMIERGQPIDGVADVRESVVIQQLSQEKARLQGEKAQRSATLLSNHPTIQALTAQIAELNNQISLEGRRVADALEAEAQIEAGIESSLTEDLARAKASASTVTQDTVTLDALQREAKAQRDLLEGYLQRYSEAASRTDANSALPDVRVVSIAAPAVSPASPKTALILLAVGIVALAGQVGLVIFGELMSGRAIVPVRAPVSEPGSQQVRPQDELEEVPFLESELEPEQRWEEPEPKPDVVPASAEVDIEPVMETLPEPTFALGVESAVAPEEAVVLAVEDQDSAAMAERTAGIENFISSINTNPVEVPGAQPESLSEPEPEADAKFGPVRQAREGMSRGATPLHSVRPSVAARMRNGLPTVAVSDLSSDLVLGRTHLLILAAHRSNHDCAMLAEDLVAEALTRGLSVALVDAGSAEPGDEPGIADLSLELASFGDVVQKSSDNSFAEITWGQGRIIDRNSARPLTLVEALGDIYEVVVLLTGNVGSLSTLSMFDGLEGRIVLVAGEEDDLAAVAASRDRLLAAGYENCEVASVPAREAA